MDAKKTVILYAGVGAGLYFLYRHLSQTCPGQTGGMCSIYNSLFGSTPPATGGGNPPPAPGGSPPPSGGAAPSGTQTQLPPSSTTVTPAAAVVAITGGVTADINNSLKATVTINGQRFTLNVIPSAGSVYDDKGREVSAQLIALGVDIPGLIAQFQKAYVPATASGVDPTLASQLKAQLAALQAELLVSPPQLQSTLQAQIQALQNQMNSLGISGLNDYPGLDLAYPYIFGKSSLGAMGDDRFAHSRVPATIIHQGPRYGFRRG